MNIIDFTAVAGNQKVVNYIQKGVGSLAFFSDNTTFAAIPESMMINVEIQRTGRNNNIEVTRGLMPFRHFILASTYGTEAINSNTDYSFIAVAELARKGFVELEGNDRLIVTFDKVPLGMHIICDGIEQARESTDIYQYESKTMQSDLKEFDFNTANFDTLLLSNSGLINEVNFTHENGVVTKHTMRELRAMSLDQDPIAAIYQNGTVQSQFDDYLTVPLVGVKSVNIRKTVGDSINAILRIDYELAALGLLQK